MDSAMRKLMNAHYTWEAPQNVHRVYEDDEIVRVVACDPISTGWDVHSWEARKNPKGTGRREHLELDTYHFPDNTSMDTLLKAILELTRRAITMQTEEDRRLRIAKMTMENNARLEEIRAHDPRYRRDDTSSWEIDT